MQRLSDVEKAVIAQRSAAGVPSPRFLSSGSVGSDGEASHLGPSSIVESGRTRTGYLRRPDTFGPREAWARCRRVAREPAAQPFLVVAR